MNRVKLNGHVGTFYIIDTTTVAGRRFYLLESERYGEDAPHVIIDSIGQEITETENGFDSPEFEDYLDCFTQGGYYCY